MTFDNVLSLDDKVQGRYKENIIVIGNGDLYLIPDKSFAKTDSELRPYYISAYLHIFHPHNIIPYKGHHYKQTCTGRITLCLQTAKQTLNVGLTL